VTRAESYSSTIAKGNVISQIPKGGETVPKGSEVKVTVSLGAEAGQCRMPYLLGLDEMTATAEVIEAGLTIKNVGYVANAEYAEGLVCYQSYSKDTYLDAGEGVEIMVSKGPESATYKCNTGIEAPTSAEAPDYVAGTPVRITLVTDAGKPLLDTTVSTFPLAINHYGIASSGGTLTFYYEVTVGGQTTTDPNTGETVVTTGTKETKSFTRRIEFVKE